MNGSLNIYKKKGKVQELENVTKGLSTKGNLGIGHTRWATHGKPNDINSHPHISTSGRLVLVHNGIIENYALLKEALSEVGHRFQTETDTEVLVNLIEEVQQAEDLSLEEAVRIALTKVTGAYAIAVIDKQEPNKLVAARKSSPLVVGIGEEEFYIASDGTPIVEYTKKAVYLKDEQVVTLMRDGKMEIKSLANEAQLPFVQELELKLEMLEKGGYDHFMLKEIYDQPNTIRDCMRGRLNAEEEWINLGGIDNIIDKLLAADRFIIVGCGTSWHSGLIAEYLFEDLARVPVEVEYASEFRYRNPILTERDVVIAISQSGETADTLAALQLAKEKGATIFGVVNVVGSSIARITDGGAYIHAGPEIGVASTKAFTGQVTMLTMLALMLAYKKGSISEAYYRQLIVELDLIPQKIEQILKNIHAEGYPAAEMKHGPIALIDKDMPVIVLATNKSAYEKIVSNIQEVKARGGRVIAIVTAGNEEIQHLADYTIQIPETEEPLTPLLSVIPLQLLSYYSALFLGCNVDQPRNLAKSVTVE